MNHIIPRCELCGKKILEFDSRLVFISPPLNQRDYIFCNKCTTKLKDYISKEINKNE